MSDETMRVAVITDVRQVELRTVPRPVPGAGEVLVRIQCCSLGPWEKRTYSGLDKETPRPFAAGHEFAGTVTAIGPGTKTDLHVGDRVAVGVQPVGRHNLDASRMEYAGLYGPLGLAEYMAVPVGRTYALAQGLSLEEGCFTESVACALYAVRKLNIDFAEDVVVIGAGPMGLLNMGLAKHRGARVIVSEIDPARHGRALKLGADAVVNPQRQDAAARVRELTGGKGADAVIVAIGDHAANQDALNMVAEFGRVMFFASAHPVTLLQIDPNVIHRQQITLTGARHPDSGPYGTAMALLSKRLIDVRPLIQQRVPLADIRDAFELAIRPYSDRIIVSL